MKLELIILLLGIILLFLGRNFYKKADTKEDINSGVFFQLDTLLLYCGSVLIITAIIVLLFS